MIVENIGGKPVYIVTKHHNVLAAWAAIRQGLNKSPLLITLDSHTDTRIAFTAFLCRTGKHDPTSGKFEAFLALANKECGKIDFRERESIINAILCLAHDEHIDAAIRAGILDHGYAITYSGFSGTPKNYDGKYDEPTPKVFHVPAECAIGCEASPHDDACHVEHSAQAVESTYLQRKLEFINEMSPTFGIANVLDQPFILDIDLDYFHSAKSIAPDDAQVFHDLIRRAVAITIATEPEYVQMCKIVGEAINSEYLLAKLKDHVSNAQK